MRSASGRWRRTWPASSASPGPIRCPERTRVGPLVAEWLPSPAPEAAATLLGALVARGLRHVVVSPGSRSQALALAAAALERTGAIALHVRIDERVAGFTGPGPPIETRV